MGGTDSGGINEIFLDNRMNSYNWLLVGIDIFVKIVVYPNFYIKFSYFSVVLVGKTFVLVVSNNQFNTQTKFGTIIPSWWGFTACQSKLGACKLAHITHFFLAVLCTLIRKLALMKSGQMSVFWIFFIKNSKNTIVSYIYNCFITIFYKKTCLESGLKYDRNHNFLAFLAAFGPFFEPKTSSKVLMCWELSLKMTNIIPSYVFSTLNGPFWPIFILQFFFQSLIRPKRRGNFFCFSIGSCYSTLLGY